MLSGAAVGAGAELGLLGEVSGVAGVHLLLAGWVCVTIMGAMTQFVPVWSGVALHSKRLARAQLVLVTGGVLGFALALRYARPSALDAALGVVGLDGLDGIGGPGGFEGSLRGAHATVAVFGAVLTTVVGALYQLATMFTQTDLDGLDEGLRTVEEWGYPVGVLALATGRLLGVAVLGRIGAVSIGASLGAVSVILGRRLHGTRVDRTPMLTRYAVVAGAMALWALLTAPAWLADPLAPDALLGAPGTARLLGFGVIGFVVCGTLYHVVPFLVWVQRYSDRLGYEPVPMIDDLYDDRLAAADFGTLLGGCTRGWSSRSASPSRRSFRSRAARSSPSASPCS